MGAENNFSALIQSGCPLPNVKGTMCPMCFTFRKPSLDDRLSFGSERDELMEEVMSLAHEEVACAFFIYPVVKKSHLTVLHDF